MMGQVVKSLEFTSAVGSGKYTMDLSDVAEGAYLYKIFNDKGKQTVGKFIVTKSNK